MPLSIASPAARSAACAPAPQYPEVRFHAGEHLLDRDFDVVVAIALLIVAHVEPAPLHVRLLARGTGRSRDCTARPSFRITRCTPRFARCRACRTGRPSKRVKQRTRADQSQSPDKYFLPSQVI